MQWKLEREGDYFRIFDENKNIAGYFAPEYGDIFPQEKAYEVIEEMHKKHEKIPGGYLLLPMIKFGIFSLDNEIEMDYLEARMDEARDRILWWQKFIASQKNQNHKIRVSHTDPDMLSITFPISFVAPVPLEKNALLEELRSTLDVLSNQGLL
ncbi:MAG: hypothetical protein HY222_07680 [Thaumarchaeota archaeon]|nr:hypothetical protein [Nitrososphaerota archaeon]MBI3642254.1 hypothetical protein [Nitrososphaerota archaeon]